MNKKLFLFDCDETLWSSTDVDYISSISSGLVKQSDHVIKRAKDSKLFSLKKGTTESFKYLNEANNAYIGIVSDNKSLYVKKALELFNLWSFVTPEAFCVKLFKGYCPKHQLVMKILNKAKFKEINKNDIYWLDDRDYSKEAKSIEVNFIKVNKQTNLYTVIKKLA